MLTVPFVARKAPVSAQGGNINPILQAVSSECSRLSRLISERDTWDGLNRERGLSLAHNIEVASLVMTEYDGLLGAAVRTFDSEDEFFNYVVDDGPNRLRDEQSDFEPLPMPFSVVHSTFDGLQENGVSGVFNVAARSLVGHCNDEQEAPTECDPLANDRDEAQVAAGIVCVAALFDVTSILRLACAVGMSYATVMALLYRIRCGQ